MRDFYSTLAQVLPVLILAICWESRYFDHLKKQDRRGSKPGTDEPYFWRKPRVRVFGIFVCGTTIVEIAIASLVLAVIIPSSFPLRVVLMLGLFLVLSTLLTRLCVDLVEATQPNDHERAEHKNPA